MAKRVLRPQFVKERGQESPRLYVAFPNLEDEPPKLLKRLSVLRIAGDISLELVGPELHSRFRRGCVPAFFVAMPKATVHEHDRVQSRQNNIGGSWQLPVVKLVAESCGVKRAPHSKLDSRVAPAHPLHDAAGEFGYWLFTCCGVQGAEAYSAAISNRLVSVRLASSENMASDIIGETLLPIIRNECQTVG